MDDANPLELSAEDFIEFIGNMDRRDIAGLISAILEYTIKDITSEDEKIRYRGKETLAFVNGYLDCHKKHINPTSLMLSGHMISASEQFYKDEENE